MCAKNSKQKLARIMGSELCNRCGSCMGLSKGAITFADREGSFRPVLSRDLEEKDYDRILDACSGASFDFPAHREHFYPDAPGFHTFTGPYHSIHIGHAIDPELRSTGASGGIISALLVYLLEKKKD